MNKIENKQIKHHKTFIKTKNKAKRKHFQEPYLLDIKCIE